MRPPGLRVIFSVGVIVAVACYAAYVFSSTPGTVYLQDPPSQFSANGRTFGITYIAANQSSRETGLMGRRITNSTIMLFVFPAPGDYAFWMSHVNSSLDIIWLSVNGDTGRVVSLASEVPGCTSPLVCPDYLPSSSANWVLEAKGGFAETCGIGVGTVIAFS